MLENQILFTTPAYPYPTLPANDSMTDATGQRFTKGDNLFTIISHTHCFANHILAQNIDVPSVLLEYPRWEDFTKEVDKGYPIIGISAYPVHLDRVLEMCEYIRKRSPATKILTGSYAGMAFRAKADRETQKKYFDYIVHGEGVRFLRRFLGEDTNRPIKQALMPKAGGSPPFLNMYPKGTIGFLVSGLGCIGGCDFCSTTALYDRTRQELLTPKELVEHMQLYHDHFPEVTECFIIEEDHFRFPEYLMEVREHWMKRPEVGERIDWFGFGSIDHIGKMANKYGWDAIAETGIGTVFVGVESKFAGQHGYDKRDEIDAREVFTNLHRMGIRTVGAWMCGWDWHNHSNMYEDLNYFISLYPTYQQLTRVSPFPGTALWAKLKEEDRVKEVLWEDVHFWSSAQKNINLESHETLNLTEYGYDQMYKTWGPSILRRLDVQLSGYVYWSKHPNRDVARHRQLFFKRQCAMLWNTLAAMDRYAPNGVVRRRVRDIEKRYRRTIGEPTPMMQITSKAFEVLATAFKVKEMYDPMNRHPKEEPFKRYIYKKNGHSNGAVPYETEWPTKPSLEVRLGMNRAKVVRKALSAAAMVANARNPGAVDNDLDEYLKNVVGNGIGLGF